MRDILEKVSDITKVGWEEIYNIYKESPELFTPNMNIQRNEGFHRSKGEKLWSRAQKVIPGGNSLLSKNPELFLPNKWPTYYKEAKGSRITDLDGNSYLICQQWVLVQIF